MITLPPCSKVRVIILIVHVKVPIQIQRVMQRPKRTALSLPPPGLKLPLALEIIPEGYSAVQSLVNSLETIPEDAPQLAELSETRLNLDDRTYAEL